MLPLVQALARHLPQEGGRPWTDGSERPFAFFGHSLGARLAFELARSLRRQKRALPMHLMVSACSAPQLPPANPPIHTWPRTAFLAELQRRNGLAAEVAAEPELVDLLLPMLRADFAVYETAVYQREPPLACPITAFGGQEDPLVSSAGLGAWAEQTTAPFQLSLFAGDHFFLKTAETQLLKQIGQILNLPPSTWRTRVGVRAGKAGPSIPVQMLGLSSPPNAGDELLVVDNERKAREVAMYRQGKFRDVRLAKQAGQKPDDVFSQMGEEGKTGTVNLLLKADVQGSAEALREALDKLSTDEVAVKVISSGVGGLTESDVMLAAASRARIIAFNVRADAAARTALRDQNVEVRYYSIIYEAIDDIRTALTGMLAPEVKEQILGLAEVRDVFRSSKFGTVAGCLVVDGYVRRNNPIRVLRDNVVIFEGELESLKRFKDDASEVRAGTECGIGVKGYNDIKVGDQIECFERVEVARQL